MDSSRIASIQLSGLRPLGGAGDRDYARLRDMLMSRLGQRHAGLLAEPVYSPDGSRVDWYVRGAQRGVPLSSLPAPERELAEKRLDELRSDILRLAQTLETENSSGAALAACLRNAVTVPGPDNFYAIQHGDGTGYWPVLVAWAHSFDETPGYQGGLSTTIPLRPAPAAGSSRKQRVKDTAPPIQPSVATGTFAAADRTPLRWNWLLWPLFVLLLAIIFWLLLRACGFVPAPYSFLNFCRPLYSTSMMQQEETGRLLDVMRNLEQQLAVQQSDCANRRALLVPPDPSVTADPIPVPDPVPAPDPQEQGTRDLVIQSGGSLGRLQFTLTWEGRSDLDLAVTCPNGQTISYERKRNCGGTLDVDMMGARNSTSDGQQVENIFWGNDSDPPAGNFKIRVNHYSSHQDTRVSVPYRVVVFNEGSPPVAFEGSVSKQGGPGEQTHTYEYTR